MPASHHYSDGCVVNVKPRIYTCINGIVRLAYQDLTYLRTCIVRYLAALCNSSHIYALLVIVAACLHDGPGYSQRFSVRFEPPTGEITTDLLLVQVAAIAVEVFKPVCMIHAKGSATSYKSCNCSWKSQNLKSSLSKIPYIYGILLFCIL